MRTPFWSGTPCASTIMTRPSSSGVGAVEQAHRRATRRTARRGRIMAGGRGSRVTTLLPRLFPARFFGTVGPSPELPADHELQPGPDLVDGADLDVHEACGEGDIPDDILGDI